MDIYWPRGIAYILSIVYVGGCLMGMRVFMNLRDWSIIPGRGGGATKREGGQVKFYSYKN